MRCMERTIKTFGILKTEVQELLDGYKWDAEGCLMETNGLIQLIFRIHHYFDIFSDQLLIYCQCVASSVGVMCCRIFGITKTNVLGFARDMGIGLQLTNIARDIVTDAEEGRVFIPLAMFKPGERERLLANPWYDPDRIRSLALQLLAQAEEYYHRAETFGIPALPRSAQVAVLLARYFP
jgi:phytoene/squalene synthetase